MYGKFRETLGARSNALQGLSFGGSLPFSPVLNHSVLAHLIVSAERVSSMDFELEWPYQGSNFNLA